MGAPATSGRQLMNQGRRRWLDVPLPQAFGKSLEQLEANLATAGSGRMPPTIRRVVGPRRVVEHAFHRPKFGSEAEVPAHQFLFLGSEFLAPPSSSWRGFKCSEKL